MIADLQLGSADAQPFTLSFMVQSSVAGVYPIAFRNGAADRFYVTTYAVDHAGAPELKSITVPGDTTGTWPVDNSKALSVYFDLGCGSDCETGSLDAWQAGNRFAIASGVKFCRNAGAWINIWDVQLAPGAAALPFQRRPLAIERLLCERYFAKSYDLDTAPGSAPNYSGAIGTLVDAATNFGAIYGPTLAMRTGPTVTLYNPQTGSPINPVRNTWAGTDHPATVLTQGERGFFCFVNNSAVAANNALTTHYTADAELY